MTWTFLATALVIVATPGTGVVLTLVAGLAHGPRASVVAAFGCTLGIVPHIVAAVTGAAALLHASALAFQALKLAGVVYLLGMAIAMLRQGGPLRLDVVGRPEPRRDADVVRSAVLANVLNPKLSLFFVAFLPQFVDTGRDGAVVEMLMLSSAFMALTFAVFVIYGLAAAAFRDHVLARPRVLTWMRRSFAAAFVGLGARLATESR